MNKNFKLCWLTLNGGNISGERGTIYLVFLHSSFRPRSLWLWCFILACANDPLKKKRKKEERETARSLLKLDFSIVCILRHDSSTTSSLPCYLHVQGSSTTFEKVPKGSSEGLNRLNHQLLKDLKINLQLSRKVNFYYLLSKVKISINLQNVSRCFKSHYFSWSSRDSSSWRISKLEKPVLISQKHFLSTLQYPTT